MTIDCWASMSHFRDHMLPIWRELEPLGVAGSFFVPRHEAGFEELSARDATESERPIMVASYQDAQRFPNRPVIYVEHGAGQTYETDRDSEHLSGYSGGSRMEHVELFICPHQTVADRWLARYPSCMAVAVGCPKMDEWHLLMNRPWSMDHVPTVAVTFHWDVAIIPETRYVLPHYQDRFPDLSQFIRAQGWRLIGHGHPRMARALEEFYGRHGVEWVPDLATVFDQADLLMADNTSALPEFASLGRPVVWLNAPWYRREISHGGRFWDWPRWQYQASDMRELLAVLPLAMADPPEVRRARQAMVETIYSQTDGHAAERAAAAIVGLL